MTTITGHRAVGRNGFLPERQILTGIGVVDVQVPKVRDRSGWVDGIHFHVRSDTDRQCILEIIASTEGNVSVDGREEVKIGLNIYKKP